MIMGRNRVLCCIRAICLCLTNTMNFDYICPESDVMYLPFEHGQYAEKHWRFLGRLQNLNFQKLKKIKIACGLEKVHNQCVGEKKSPNTHCAPTWST